MKVRYDALEDCHRGTPLIGDGPISGVRPSLLKLLVIGGTKLGNLTEWHPDLFITEVLI